MTEEPTLDPLARPEWTDEGRWRHQALAWRNLFYYVLRLYAALLPQSERLPKFLTEKIAELDGTDAHE